MHDLLSFKELRIEALQKEVSRLNAVNDKYETFIFELIDKDCPREYKDVVKSELWSDLTHQ